MVKGHDTDTQRKMDISIEGRPTYLYVRVTDMFDLKQAVTRFNKALIASAEHKIFKILIDYRELRGVPASMTEEYVYAASIAEKIHDYVGLTTYRFVWPMSVLKDAFDRDMARKWPLCMIFMV